MTKLKTYTLCLYDCTVILLNFALLATQYFIIDLWYRIQYRNYIKDTTWGSAEHRE